MKAAGFFSTYSLGLGSDSVFIKGAIYGVHKFSNQQAYTQ
jgi:hypothetical protein